ncbi:MAG: DNA helicase RecQ [Planctomycetes bacterium]|nr:DNA helicase RecQ [Planctomycetota bacterium]
MDDPALNILKSIYGYDSFRGPQRAIIDHVVAGGDALVLMPTGGGKSLCYQIPAILRDGTGIIVSPLIALMQDQVTAMRELGVRATFINSSLPAYAAEQIEQEMIAGEYDLVYVAPERLVTPRFLQRLAQTKLALFAIDEAHCVSQWGHDFRPEYRQLTVLHEKFPQVPRLALTATADEPTRRDIIERLQLEEAERFISGFDRPNIQYRVTLKKNAKQQVLEFIEAEHAGDAGIVYCMSRRKVEDTAAFLVEHGHAALPYHAGLDAVTRQRNQDRFLREEGLIVVATIAFGMGIDKPNVRFVAHLDLPKSLEAYYQETGRAGRDGLASHAWMAYGLSDATTVRGFIDQSEASEQQKRVEHQKLTALLGYCETTTCRRITLLKYFGDAMDEPCGNCDTCLTPVETWDGTVAAQKALSCAYRTDQVFGAGYLADVLIGADQERIGRNGHESISTFGIGKELTRAQWMSVYRQLVAMGLLRVDPAHGSLRLTEKARPVLKGEQAVQLRKDDRPRKRERQRAGRSGAARVELKDAASSRLFDALRAKRLQLAKAQGVPPYIVFGDRTLIEMAHARPARMDEMVNISGVGQRKLAQYGQAFLEVITMHAHEEPQS